MMTSSVAAPPAVYDALAPLYDDAFSDPESLAENKAVMGIIGQVSDLEVLDIGCGTGLFLDYNLPKFYAGIDPSRGMLDRLLEKHPTVEEWGYLFHGGLESYVQTFMPYDLAVCLFGSANYIDPVHLMRIPTLAERWVVMFADEDYTDPVVAERTGHSVAEGFTPGILAPLPGVHTHLGHYTIISGHR